MAPPYSTCQAQGASCTIPLILAVVFCIPAVYCLPRQGSTYLSKPSATRKPSPALCPISHPINVPDSDPWKSVYVLPNR